MDAAVPEGRTLDAGAHLDGGVSPDAAVPTPPPPVLDGGAFDDAGMPAVASSDAGVSEDDGGVSSTDAGLPFVYGIDHAFLISHFGGNPVDAFGFDDDAVGFQEYLNAVGVTYFDAQEIITPNHPEIAASCGYMILLPTREHWQKIGALALFADQLRELVGEPVWMRNWWRPDCYNEAVGGAAGGDHPDADAVDLDFLSASSRAAAQEFLCRVYWQQDIVAPEQMAPDSDFDPRLNLSVGLGEATLHLGVLSQNGRRYWTYSSYTEEPNSGDCW